MKIIILRHGERYNSPSYLSPLTVGGLKQADDMINNLPYDIDTIYCSPFLRTIQTIYPYCMAHNKKIKIENVFYERCTGPAFNHHNYRHSTKELNQTWRYLTSIIDNNYKSKYFVSNIKINPKDQYVINRVFPFIYGLCKKYKTTDKTFLIVTHKGICNTIKKVFNKNIGLRDKFPMGHFEEVIIKDTWNGIDI